MSTTPDTLLGEAHQYTIGDRRLVIGWKRPNDFFRGSEYDYEPTGYITLETTGRSVVKGHRDMTPAKMRELAFHLNRYADTVDAFRAAR